MVKRAQSPDEPEPTEENINRWKRDYYEFHVLDERTGRCVHGCMGIFPCPPRLEAVTWLSRYNIFPYRIPRQRA